MSVRANAHPTSAPRRSAGKTRARPVVADSSRAPAPSPARLAQLELAARLAEAPVAEDRWSARRTLAFAVVGSALLWGALAAAGATLLG